MKRYSTEPSDDELLALHFQDAMNQPPPSEQELEDPEEQEESDEEPDEPQVAAPIPAVPTAPAAVQAPPGRKRGRPPGKGKDRATGVGRDTSTHAGVPMHEGRHPWPTNALEVWDKILHEHAPALGRGPQDIHILVYRYGLGQHSGQIPIKDRLYVARIDGLSVCGNDSQSPSEALADYMETVVHPTSRFAARYELAFQFRRGGPIKSGDLTLADPQEVARQRAFAAEYGARAQMDQGGGPPMPPRGMGYPPHSPAPPWPHPNQPYYQPPPYYPPPQAQDTAEVAAMRRDLATVLGRFDEMARRDAEARGAPPPAPIAPQVAPLEPEDARIARIVDAALQRAGVGRPAVGVGAPATAVATTGIAAVVGNAKESIKALQDFMGVFKELDKFRRDVGGMGAVEETVVETPAPIVEDPNSPAFGVRPIPFSSFQGKPVMWPKPVMDEDGNEVEESFLARAAKFGAANPDLALQFLERAGKVLGQGTFGQLLQAFTQQGGQAAAAAATMADRVAAGVAAPPNGAAAPPTGYPSP
jgi:hypothetical protein